MEVRLLAKTTGIKGTEYDGRTIDEIITGIARISSSRELNELFNEPEKLLRHCISNSHWSIFEEANLVIEVKTSRFVGRELLRHTKQIGIQELSQRYTSDLVLEPLELRKQSTSNRQSSTEVFNPEINVKILHVAEDQPLFASSAVDWVLHKVTSLYKILLSEGVARETARGILPETTQTTMIFNGRIREWVTLLNQRLHKTAQKECRLVAEAIRDIFIKECPIISAALFNFEDAYDIHILDRVVLEKYGVYQLIKDNQFKNIK